ncbi:hypothetical protein WJX82_007919 [Trebouxia sp. C0006]
MAGCMKVYELDMEAWQWRLLPCKGQAPLSLVMMVPVFVEGQWLVCGGKSYRQMSHGFFTFDFSSQSWSEAGLVGKPLLPRIHHMATCHEGSMVIVGGMEPSADPIKRLQPAETVQQIRARPAAPAADEPDLSARHNGLARGLRSMRHRSLLTDATVLLEGYRLQPNCGVDRFDAHGSGSAA